MEEKFVIERKDFKKFEKYAENIYNTAVVIDYFCSSQKEYAFSMETDRHILVRLSG